MDVLSTVLVDRAATTDITNLAATAHRRGGAAAAEPEPESSRWVYGTSAGRSHTVASGDLAVAHADPGQTVTGTFMIREPGAYEVYCSVPGHRESGMVATLTVDDGA
jgi:hypothetical protein